MPLRPTSYSFRLLKEKQKRLKKRTRNLSKSLTDLDGQFGDIDEFLTPIRDVKEVTLVFDTSDGQSKFVLNEICGR